MPISLFPRTRPSAPSDDALNAVGKLHQEYLVAASANDAPWFERHLAADVVMVLGDGRRLEKAEFLALLRERSRRFRSLSPINVRLRAYGPTVQVDADAAWELEDGSSGVSRSIDTWAWLEGRWQLISAQITALPR